MSKVCPITKDYCYDHVCGTNFCLRERQLRGLTIEPDRGRGFSDLWAIIWEQTETIKHLVNRVLDDHSGRAKKLTSSYIIVTSSGDISVIKPNNNMPQTITVPFGQNNVPGQLIPLAADGVTQEPINTINAGSEVYTSSDSTIATVAAVPGGAEGQYIVSRVKDAVGTVVILHQATNTDGKQISDFGGIGDTFVFQGQPTGLAQALTSQYGTPTP